MSITQAFTRAGQSALEMLNDVTKMIEEYQISPSKGKVGKGGKSFLAEKETKEVEEELLEIREIPQRVARGAVELLRNEYLQTAGREPTDAELGAALAGVMRALHLAQLELADDPADEDYRPTAHEMAQAGQDEHSDFEVDPEALKKEVEELNGVGDEKDEFDAETRLEAKEWREALDNVRRMALGKGRLILERVMARYEEETGAPVEEQVMSVALEVAKEKLGVPQQEAQGAEEQEKKKIPQDVDEKEWNEAIDGVRALAQGKGKEILQRVVEAHEKDAGEHVADEVLAVALDVAKEKLGIPDVETTSALTDPTEPNTTRAQLLAEGHAVLDSILHRKASELDDQKLAAAVAALRENLHLSAKDARKTSPCASPSRGVAFYSPLRGKRIKSKVSPQLRASQKKRLLRRAKERFQKTHNREPTDEEKENLITFLNANDKLPLRYASDSDDDSDYDPSNDKSCDATKDAEDEVNFEHALTQPEADEDATIN